jgi:transketolase
MNVKSPIDFQNQSKAIRSSILEMVSASSSSHIAAAFSIVDILTVLYFSILNIDPTKPKAYDRDRFLLSKGHGGAALYATLAHRGFAPLEVLSQYAKDGSVMAGHIVKDSMAGVETTAGSLGHGLPMAIGMALALKAQNSKSRVVVLLGDGECNEGTTWEGALVAAHFKLDNLLVIVDRNGEQSLGKSNDVLNMEPFAEKWSVFGWNALESDGHDFTSLAEKFDKKRIVSNKPTVVIAKTIKGKGVSYMENDPLIWHYRTPKEDLLVQARKELDA